MYINSIFTCTNVVQAEIYIKFSFFLTDNKINPNHVLNLDFVSSVSKSQVVNYNCVFKKNIFCKKIKKKIKD